MNVAAGGTLYQDLEIEGKFEHHFGDKYPRNYPWHDLTIEKVRSWRKSTVKPRSGSTPSITRP